MRTKTTPRTQTVVVTGATGGIGRASARELAKTARHVALLARGSTGLEAVQREVEEAGANALAIEVDMADAEAVERAAQQIEDELGPIHVWVNVAFTSVFARFVDIEPAEFRRVTEVTYLGFVHGTRAALRRMLPRDHGTVVQVGSALGQRGIPLQSAYCGAKHALEGFHESLRAELRHDGSSVQVTIVEMPGVNTPQFDWVLNKLPDEARPVAPVYQPEVSARAVAYAAAHPRRRAYWVGASTAGTIVANRVVGGLLDRYLARTNLNAQQTSMAHSTADPVNLWDPADGPDGRDFGAHGRFDDESLGHSAQAWMSRHRASIGATLAASAAAGFAAKRSR